MTLVLYPYKVEKQETVSKKSLKTTFLDSLTLYFIIILPINITE